MTPLRDGMNLVAKEYVAAQDPERTRASLSSRGSRARQRSSETRSSRTRGTPRAQPSIWTDALRMPGQERKLRHAKLLDVISKHTALTWAEDFLSALGSVDNPS